MSSFSLEYYYNGFYPYFVLSETMTDLDFRDFINVLQAIVDMDKPFVFLVDTTQLLNFNGINCGWEVIKWMKKNKSLLKKNLRASAVIMKSKTVVDILNWIFEKQPPMSPNKITLDREEAENFVNNFLPPEIRIATE